MRFFSNTVFAAALAAGLLALGASTASAEPLVKMNGDKAEPGVVTAWSSSGNKVELTLKDGTDANAVAQAIEGNVEKVKAKVQGGKVVVIGKAEADLLKALSSVELGGDLGALAQAGGSGDESDSGSSLRAKKTVDLAKLLKDQATSAQGQVVEAGGSTFPNAEVVVNVTRAPTGDLGKEIRKGKKIKFRPVLKMKGKEVDWTDQNTQNNVGAWYLQKGDKVFVKIAKCDKDVCEAEIIARQ